MADKDTLVTNLEALVKGYDNVVVILDNQIDAVVKNDLKRIEQLAEEQVINSSNLESLEVQLKNVLNRFDTESSKRGEQPGLGEVIKNHFSSDKQVIDLRTSLLTRIADSQRLQHQLNSLLSFAREHIEQTLQRIYSLNKESTIRYDQYGKKNHQDRSIFSRYA